MPAVCFIRHAESEANIGQATAHPATIKLTPKGIEQAHSIAAFFKRSPDLIITSPYERTRETAQPTLRRFSTVRHEEWSVEEFTYLSPLDTLTTPLDRKPKADAFWQRQDPFYVDGKGTESFTAFIVRVQTIVKRLRETKELSVVVFSHEQFILAIQWLFLKSKLEPDSIVCSDGMKQFKDYLTMFRLPNGAILPMQLQDDSQTWISSIITSHLSPSMGL
jgi:probable phosphoglycerate mutase